MAVIPTIRVTFNKGGYTAWINAGDFDPELHVLYVDPAVRAEAEAEAKKTAKAAAAAATIDVTPEPEPEVKPEPKPEEPVKRGPGRPPKKDKPEVK